MRLALGATVAAVGVAMLLGAGSVLGGCKEGVGEHCVVNSDCSSGLLCNQATGECATKVTTDATPITDVRPPDDAVIDGLPDAPK